MLFRILAFPIALLFFAAFFGVRRYCVGEKFKPLWISSYGFVFAGIGLSFGSAGWIDLGIFSVSAGILIFMTGGLIHIVSIIKAKLPSPRKWDE